MGLYWKNKEIFTQTEMCLAIKEASEKMMTSMMGDMLKLSGATLDEIPVEYVEMYNGYIKQYKEMFDIVLRYTKYQDELTEQRDRKIDEILKISKENASDIAFTKEYLKQAERAWKKEKV